MLLLTTRKDNVYKILCISSLIYFSNDGPVDDQVSNIGYQGTSDLSNSIFKLQIIA